MPRIGAGARLPKSGAVQDIVPRISYIMPR